MKRLDKTRDYGTIHPAEIAVGDTTVAAHFNQDGYYFDHEGNLVEALLTPEQKKKLAAKPAAAKAKTQAKPAAKPKADAGDEQEAEDASDEADGNDEAKPAADGDELNIVSWLMGEIDYPVTAVREAVKKRYNTWKTSTRELILFLVEDQKVVTPKQLKPEWQQAIGMGKAA